jgi:hypothetical protein
VRRQCCGSIMNRSQSTLYNVSVCVHSVFCHKLVPADLYVPYFHLSSVTHSAFLNALLNGII